MSNVITECAVVKIERYSQILVLFNIDVLSVIFLSTNRQNTFFFTYLVSNTIVVYGYVLAEYA